VLCLSSFLFRVLVGQVLVLVLVGPVLVLVALILVLVGPVLVNITAEIRKLQLTVKKPCS